jgi:hypothetical protein
MPLKAQFVRRTISQHHNGNEKASSGKTAGTYLSLLTLLSQQTMPMILQQQNNIQAGKPYTHPYTSIKNYDL